MSPRRSARRSWHNLFGSDAAASPPNPPVTHGKSSERKKGAKPSPPPPTEPKNLPPSDPKNLPGNSQMSKKRKPAPIQERVRPGKKRKPAPFERAWSTADELRILTALVAHADSHAGALPEPPDLFAALAGSFDNGGADADKLADKVRKLRRRHGKARLQACPGDDHGRQMFELCEKVWGHGSSRDSGHGDDNVMATHGSSPRKSNKRGDVAPQEANQEAGAVTALRRSPRKISDKRDHAVPLQADKEGCDKGGDGHPPTRAPEGNWGFAKYVPQEPGKGAVDVGADQDISLPLPEDGDVDAGKRKNNGGRVEEDRRANVTYVKRQFNELSRLYPYLAEELKGYTSTHCSVELIMAAFQTIDDEEARNLDARCKKQRIDKLNLEMNQADLTKVLLCKLAGLIN